MRFSEAFPSIHLSAADLKGQTVALTIKSVTVEEIGLQKDRKPVVWFSDAKKGLCLNVTNGRTIKDLYGDDMDAWTGQRIELFPTYVDFQGRQVQAIRVRPVAPTQEKLPAATQPTVDPDLNDPIDL